MEKQQLDLLIGLDEKISTIDGKVHSIDITVAKQEVNIREHMRRTEINETRLELFEERVAPALDAYKFMATLFKVLIGLATIGSVLLGICKLLIK